MITRLIRLVTVILLITGCESLTTREPVDRPTEAVEAPRPVSADRPGTAQVVGGDEAALREFIEHYVSGPGSTGETTVLIGALPEDLPFDLPIPENARVIGSVVMQDDMQNTNILLETMLTPDEAETFYEETLPDHGWVAPPETNQSGFVPSSGTLMLAFCHQESKSYLNLFIGSGGANGTVIQTWIVQGQPYSPCDAQSQGRGNESTQILPALTAPAGIRQELQTSGGGSTGAGQESAFHSATLVGNLTAAELANHYNVQLEEAGWTMITGGGEEDAAWSIWAFTNEAGEMWTGELFIMRAAEEDRYLAWIQVEHQFDD